MKKAKWFKDETDAKSYASENGLQAYWFGGKGLWIACSNDEWNAIICGDVIIC